MGAVKEWNNYQYFGTISRAMFSLFNMILLSEWNTHVRPAWETHWPALIAFILLVVVTTFGLLNVIIGVIVERTNLAMSQVREDELRLTKLKRQQTVKLLADIAFSLDGDADEKLSKEELELGAEHAQLVELLQAIDLPRGFSFANLHEMLDENGSGMVSKKEFVLGMYRLIYCDSFQRDCMNQLTVGQVKMQLQELKYMLKKELKKTTDLIRAELKVLGESLRRDVGTSAEGDGARCLNEHPTAYDEIGLTGECVPLTSTTSTRQIKKKVSFRSERPAVRTLGPVGNDRLSDTRDSPDVTSGTVCNNGSGFGHAASSTVVLNSTGATEHRGGDPPVRVANWASLFEFHGGGPSESDARVVAASSSTRVFM